MSAIKVGATKYGGPGVVQFATYHHGGTAIRVASEDGELVYVATVFIEGHVLPENEVWIKDWSENEGVAQAFVDAGLITLSGRRVPTGYVEAMHAVLTERALAAMAASR